MSKEPESRSLAKGFLAGLAGGLAGAGIKLLAEQVFPPRVSGQTSPPALLAEQMAGRTLPDGQRKAAEQGIHWVFGALAGGIYGALVEFEPEVGAWRGAAFGITLNRITHEALLPKMGLSAPPNQMRTEERISEWVTHAVYGIATDTVRRSIRKGL
jgi:putative membrane protein